MKLEQVSPNIASSPNVIVRLQNRIQTTCCASGFIYLLFFTLPCLVCTTAVAAGRRYGFEVYRWSVSWLYFYVISLLVVDPFVVRYRHVLLDAVGNSSWLCSCNRTLLRIWFQRGIMYHCQLTLLSLGFVTVEAVLEYAGVPRDACLRATSAIFVLFMTGVVVTWFGYVIVSHTQVMVVRSDPRNTSMGPDSDMDQIMVEIPENDIHRILTASGMSPKDQVGKRIVVRVDKRVLDNWEKKMAGGAVVPFQTDRQGRVQLNQHLQDVKHTMVLHSNSSSSSVVAMTVISTEPDRATQNESKGFLCCCCLPCRTLSSMRYTLAINVFIFVVVMLLLLAFQDSISWLKGDALNIAYAVLTVFGLYTMYGLYVRGQPRYGDRIYLQVFLASGTYVPVVLGTVLLRAQARLSGSSSSTDDAARWSAVALFALTILGAAFYGLSKQLITKMAAPHVYASFLFVPQVTIYLLQYVLFGITPWSMELVGLMIASAINNLMVSVGAYIVIANTLKRWIFETVEAQHTDAFEQLLDTAFMMQEFVQDTLSDTLSFFTVVGLVYFTPLTGLDSTQIIPAFSRPYLAIRIALLLSLRMLTWLVAERVFRYRLKRASILAGFMAASSATNRSTASGKADGPPPVPPRPDQKRTYRERRASHQATKTSTRTLATCLESHLMRMAIDDRQRAEILQCYEDEVPELLPCQDQSAPETFTSSSSASSSSPSSPSETRSTSSWHEAVPDIASLISRWRSFVRPYTLRRHFLYFHAGFYLLLFIALQNDTSVPLRYSWYRPSS